MMRRELVFLFIITQLVILSSGGSTMAGATTTQKRHVVLIGASVGKAWNIPELPKRVGNADYSFEYVGLYQFDKTSALEEILSRKENRPDAIILKECAAYFPSDISFEQAKALMQRWVEQSREKDVVPIPTTIVPVTRTHDEKFKTHSWIKRTVKRILGISMDTRMERIIEYNDWVRDYFESKGLVVLDLEAPLRISPINRFLRDDLTKGDGLHLNSKAYKILDGFVIPSLKRVRFPD